MIILTCDQCGKSYETKPYMKALSKKHFCCLACYGEWQKTNRKGFGKKRVIVNCDTCGKKIERIPSAVSDHNFCCKTCKTKWQSIVLSGDKSVAWLGGNDDYRGPNWNKQRKKATKRDDNKCTLCGKTSDLIVHHAKPFRLFDDYRKANMLENLVTLCRRCHGHVEIDLYRNNPELANLSAPLPVVLRAVSCKKCGKDFFPKSGRSETCDNCCSATCEYCGMLFYSRKATFRKIKYCSSACRNAAIKRKPQVCKGCGKEYLPNRSGTMYCSNHCRLTLGNPRRQFFAKRKLAVLASSRP